MGSASVIEVFLSRARLGHQIWSVALALLGHGTVVVVLLLIAEILAPRWLGTFGACAAAWLSVVGISTWLRSGTPLRIADRRLGLEDRLLTWAGPTRQRADRAMVNWLEEDLVSRIEKVDHRESRRLLRRPLGRLRYLIPILAVLMVLRVLAIFFPPMFPGGEQEVARGGEEAVSEAQVPAASGAAQLPPVSGSESVPAVQPPPESATAPPDPISAPKPLIEHLAAKDEFVIPAFLRDGEKRKALSRIAVLEEGAERPAIGAKTPMNRSGPDPRRQPGTEEFQRSWEAAVRARNLPVSEREFVRAYFLGLIGRGR